MYCLLHSHLRFVVQGSRDNMSIVLVTFPAAPGPSAEAIQREAELEATIERRITGNCILKINYKHKLEMLSLD